MDRIQDGFQNLVFGGYPVYQHASRPVTLVRAEDYREKHPHKYPGSQSRRVKRRR